MPTQSTLRAVYPTVIIGGGPAGTAVLLAASRQGHLHDLLRDGLLLIERGPRLGAGGLGSYVINSDSTGDAFVDPLRTSTEPALRALLETPVARRIAAAGQAPVPLQQAGELLQLIGQTLHTLIDAQPASAVLTGAHAHSACRQPDGSWLLRLTPPGQPACTVRARNLVLATGAAQPSTRLAAESVAGAPLVPTWGHKLFQSGEILREGGLERAAHRLASASSPSVAIVGGSTSAMAVAHALLHRLPPAPSGRSIRFAPGSITLLHRRPLRVYYPSIPQALADDYTEFQPTDICPLTQRVFRLAGLRLDSRELLMQVRGIGGRPPEPRLHLHQLRPGHDAAAQAALHAATLVIAAFGYRPNALRLLSAPDTPLRLLAHTSPTAPLVDARCRVLDHASTPLPGLFGIGLAAGFVPHGALGGEPSFRGQANGLWLWQNDVGALIVEALLASATTTVPHPVPQLAAPSMLAASVRA